jgi:uncharacterized protein YjdB
MAFQLKDSQQLPLEVEALDAEGNAAAITVTFASSDESIVAITDNGDGSAMAVASPGAAGLGTATVTATATGTDGSSLEGSLEIEVIAGDAVSINILPGTPEDKPAVEPPVEPAP